MKKLLILSLLCIIGCHAEQQENSNQEEDLVYYEIDTLRVMTYNLFMLPYQALGKNIKDIAELVGVDPSTLKISQLNTQAKERAAKIPQVIKSLADVYTFQEGFDENARKILRAGMKAAGINHSTQIMGRSFLASQRLTNSGLFIMSKYPIEASDGIYYQDSFQGKNGIQSFDSDRLADKGIVYIKINKDGKKYHIFTTHTQAKTHHGNEVPPLGCQIRAKQLERLKQFIDSKKIPAHEPVIITGDFNMDSANPNSRLHCYEESQKIAAMLNATQPESQEKYTAKFKSAREDNDQPGQWIDYVLYSNEHQKPDTASLKVYQEIELSDHYPVVGTFEFIR